jgi:putative tricarboxylic transport membrane protein
MKRRTLIASALALAAGLVASPAFAQGYPNERLNVTVAFGPGGGNDILSRTLVSILEKYKMYPKDIVITNRAGGSGAVGWGYVFSQKGNPYHLSTTSGSFVTTPLQANTPWKPTSFTPVALVATDDLLLLVNGKSDIKDFKTFVERARSKSPSIGGMGAVNVDYIVPKVVSEKANFKFEYVSFNKMGELTTALLSNSLDAAMGNPAEVLGLIASGDLRALAYSGKATPDSLKGVPTMASVGYDPGVSLPRGLILPPGVPKEAQDWWIATMKKVVQTPEWKKYINDNNLTENIQYGDDFNKFLGNTQDSFARILRASGAIK